MEYNFRAAYKLDKETENGYSMFYQKEINKELFFVMDKDKDIKYPFYIPFIDKSWIVMMNTGYKDINNKFIYTGDIVVVKDPNDKINVLYYIGFDEFNSITAFALLDGDISSMYSFNLNFLLKSSVAKNTIRVIGNIYESPDLVKLKKAPRNIKKKERKTKKCK